MKHNSCIRACTIGIKLCFLICIAQPVFCQLLNPRWPVLKKYEGKKLTEVAMPLGGIGTGTISIGGRGDLRDWEIMNRGAIGFLPAYKIVEPAIANGPFFALYYKRTTDKRTGVKILEGPLEERYYQGDWGADVVNAGFPRFNKVDFNAAYPLAQLSFQDRDVPLQVRLEAFNPLVPGEENKSGIPVAILRYVLTNTSNVAVEAAVCGMIPNYIGDDGWTGHPAGNYNVFRKEEQVNGLYMFSKGVDSSDINWGTMSLTTTAKEGVSYRTTWKKLGWNWTLREFWDDFSADGTLTDWTSANTTAAGEKNIYAELSNTAKEDADKIQTPPATLAVKLKLLPGESRTITFFITWHFPNRKAWDDGTGRFSWGFGSNATVGNYYTTQYKDAWDVAVKTVAALPQLENETVQFVSAMTHNDLPEVIKEAALSNLANLRCQTVFRTADGLPFAWEGTGSINGTKVGKERSSGWGFGTCTHVWNYESATPYLFGRLATLFREVEFMHATHDNGGMEFRVPLPLGNSKEWTPRAADGQMGCIIKAYREWQLSGDKEKLKIMWPNIKSALSFAWLPGSWDADKDGVMEGSQHNTMDIDYKGPNPQMSGWYLGALRAAEEMARYVNDTAFAKEVHTLFVKGQQWVDSKLFNGEYYEQQIPKGATTVAQLGKGCLVDQLVGASMARMTGLGEVLEKRHIQTTLRSIMKYNRVSNFNNHFNTFRSFGAGNETGWIMASYPHGGLLDFPFPYYTEIMTGFEYSTAAHMMYEGMTEEGLAMYRAIRNRFDGEKRNPFDEGEYGHRYGRAMASWNGILAYTGFLYSALTGVMHFNDRTGRYFWSNGYQYGIVEISGRNNIRTVKITTLNGDLLLNEFHLNGFGTVKFSLAEKLKAGNSKLFTIKKMN